jgi:hypothetical protein
VTYKFSSYLNEAKNTHLEHLEDLIFNEGIPGALKSINFIRDLRNMLAGHSKTAQNLTTKWDGAPALFAGIDPADGKFFIGTKGVFAKNPKLIKTAADINKNGYPPGLAKKLKVAFAEFPKLGITNGVYQGDLMFTKQDIKVETIEGEKYYSFQPNTIVYVVPVNSGLGKIISKSKIGIIWHTTYTGSSLANMSASFGKGILDKFKKTPSIWMDDATYKDVSGTASMTAEETKKLTALISRAGAYLNKISSKTLNAITANPDLSLRIKAYNNSHIKMGVPFPHPYDHVKGLMNHISDYYTKEINIKKSPKGKQTASEKKNAAMKVLAAHDDLVNIYYFIDYMIQAKMVVVNKLNSATAMGTFIRTSSGLKATDHEGFVAIDHVRGAIKLIDRLEFSRANFSPDVIKGWQR